MTSRKTAKELDAFIRSLRQIGDTLSGDISINQMLVFLTVAHNERFGVETTMVDLAKGIGLTQASASRNIQALSKWRKKDYPGYDLIEQFLDPVDRRRKPLRLTPTGKQTLKRVEEAI